MTELQAQVIIALADNNLNVSDTARQMFMHRNTVVYHIRAIHNKTGKNPLNFYDFCDLLRIAKGIFRKAHGEE